MRGFRLLSPTPIPTRDVVHQPLTTLAPLADVLARRNEFHHLLIMESLGGDQRWSDRFAAQHSAANDNRNSRGTNSSTASEALARTPVVVVALLDHLPS